MKSVTTALLSIFTLPAAAATLSLGGVQSSWQATDVASGGNVILASGLSTGRAGTIEFNFDGTDYKSAAADDRLSCADVTALALPRVNSVGGPANDRIISSQRPGVGLPPGFFASNGAGANDSCYLAVSFSTTSFLVPDGFRLDYIGFFWGSIDPYNRVAFFDAASGGSAVAVTGYGAAIDGTELWGLPGVGPFGEAYVNFAFSPFEDVRRIDIISDNVAFELDNLAIVLSLQSGMALAQPVPEPGSAALLGLAAALLLRRSRRA